MANGNNNPIPELRDQRKQLKQQENRSRRQEQVRSMQLKALQRAQKETGRATKIAAGEVAGRTAQLGTVAALGIPTRMAGTALAPFTLGTSAAAGQAAAMTAEQAAYQAGKRTARPIAKQLGKAPYRPLIAMQKARVRSARRSKEEARAEGQALDRELAALGDRDIASTLLKIPKWVLAKTLGLTIALPIEVLLSLVAMILVPIVMILLLVWYIAAVVVPFYGL